MKNLINNVTLKTFFKSLMVNGTLKNIHLKVKGNVLTVGEISLCDNNKNSHLDVSLSKESGGNIILNGSHDCKLVINNLSVKGVSGEEFSMETMELNSITEGLELFASLTK